MVEKESNEPLERELAGLPHRADRVVDLGAIKRIEDALAAEAAPGSAIVEPGPGLLARRVPVWGMLAACLMMAIGAGVVGWVLKPVETVERIRVVSEPAPEIDGEESDRQPVVEIVRLDRPLFERGETRSGIEPSRWTVGH